MKLAIISPTPLIFLARDLKSDIFAKSDLGSGILQNLKSRCAQVGLHFHQSVKNFLKNQDGNG